MPLTESQSRVSIPNECNYRRPSGVLWVGTAGHGLNAFNRRNGRFKTFRHSLTDQFSLSNDLVTRLLIDHAGTLWATTFDGLNRFDSATSHFTVHRLDHQDTAQIYIEIKEDLQGALWLGTHSSGLQRFDPVAEVFTVYRHNPNDPTTLSNNRVNAVNLGRAGEIWVGTQNGLNKFDPQTGKFTVYYERDGLPGNLVSCILDDERGNLWMSTNNGLSKFDPLNKTFRNYSAADGLPGSDLTGWGACFKNTSGEMFFGGFSGGIAFHPDSVVDDLYIPPIVFTDFRLFGNPVKIGDGSPLDRSIGYSKALRLPHDKKILSLEFSALSYFNPATNRYRYKLEGLDSEWHEVASDQRLVSYTTLPAGGYTFRVQGATSRGAWSDPALALAVEILAPWWSTWWFRAFYTAIILLVVWSAYRYRLDQMARQYNLRLEERVGERTRIAQELHDTLLQGFLSASMQLHIATDNLPSDSPSKPLLRRVLQLMGQVIEEGRAAIRGLRLTQASFKDLGQAFAQMQQEFSIDERLDFRVVVAGEPKSLHPVLRDEIYRIGREALTNAFRHSRARKIVVELEYETKHFRLLVRDDGQGLILDY